MSDRTQPFLNAVHYIDSSIMSLTIVTLSEIMETAVFKTFVAANSRYSNVISKMELAQVIERGLWYGTEHEKYTSCVILTFNSITPLVYRIKSELMG